MSQLTSSEINIALVTLGGLVIVLGLFSGLLKERFFLSDPIVALLLAVAILLLRRLPAMLLVRPLLGRLRGMQDALFLGWFGSIGVAALFYAFLSLRKAGVEEPWIVGSLVICASILAHGLTAVPLAKLYAKQQRRSQKIS